MRELTPAAAQREKAQLASCAPGNPVQIGALSVSLAAWLPLFFLSAMGSSGSSVRRLSRIWGKDSSPHYLVASDSSFLLWGSPGRSARRLFRILDENSSPRWLVASIVTLFR